MTDTFVHFEEDEQLAGVVDLLTSLLGVGSNAASQVITPTFALRDYCWCGGVIHPEVVDDDSEDFSAAASGSGGESTGCPPNFEHFASGIRGTWYKHAGRELRFNRPPQRGEALEILRDCLRGIALSTTIGEDVKKRAVAATADQRRRWGWSS